MDQYRLARLELGIVEQHMLNGAKGDGRKGRPDRVHAGGCCHELAGGDVDFFLREAVEMKAVDAADMFAQIVAALATGLATAADARAIDRHQIAGQHVRYPCADRLDHAGGFRADRQRQLALGERHAAPAPDIDMVERDRLQSQRHLARRWRARLCHVAQFDLAVIGQLQGAHGSFLHIQYVRATN